MSEERTTRKSFFSRMFTGEEEEAAVPYPEEVQRREPVEKPQEASRGFTVERAAGVIRELPPEVPRQSAVRIVRQTLEATGITVGDLESSNKARESKLNSLIDQRQRRISKLREDAEEGVSSLQERIRSLEEDIRKLREARDNGISQEEEKISRARDGLEEVDLVRKFFGLSGGEDGREAPPPGQEPAGLADPEEPEVARVVEQPEEQPEEPSYEEPSYEEPSYEEPSYEEQPETAEEEVEAAGQEPEFVEEEEVVVASDEEPETTEREPEPVEEPERAEEPEFAEEPEPVDDPDATQVLRRPGPLSEDWDTRYNRGP